MAKIIGAALLLAMLVGIAPSLAKPLKILALGDSLVAGYGLPAADGFTAQLTAALRTTGHAATVIDAGVSGDTSAGGRARLDWLLTGAPPDYAILALGANDGLRGLDPQAMRNNLDAILTRLGEAQIPTLLVGMLAPPNFGSSYAAAFNNIFPDLAAQHNTVFYPFFLDGVATEPQLNQADGIHPNAAGVAVIIERIMPYLLQLLKRPPANGA